MCIDVKDIFSLFPILVTVYILMILKEIVAQDGQLGFLPNIPKHSETVDLHEMEGFITYCTLYDTDIYPLG